MKNTRRRRCSLNAEKTFSRRVLPVAITGLLILPALLPPSAAEASRAFCEVSWRHPMGCSPLGQDLLRQILQGIGQTLGVALAARLLSSLAAAAGYGLSWLTWPWGREGVQRLAEAVMTIPSLLVALSLGFFFGAGFLSVVLAVGFSEWAVNQKWLLSRLREQMNYQHVILARAAGAGNLYLLRFHLWPLLRRDMNLLFFLYLPGTLMSVTSLEFLGVSGSDLKPGLGYLVAAHRDYLFTHPAAAVAPALVIIMIIRAALRFRKQIPEFS